MISGRVQRRSIKLQSKLGWILTGRTSETERNLNETSMLILTYGKNVTNTNLFTNIDEVIPRKPVLEDFWNVESIGVVDNSTLSNDETAKSMFKDTLKFEEGRYQVTWPWKEEHPDLPVNHELAMGRLKSFISRLKCKPDVMTQYDAIIQDQVKKGIIEKISGHVQDGNKHNLPHHAVINPLKTTTKVRVVYDASAKSRTEN